jgi:tetratricopeptide (TPR) repeat protein
MWKRLKTLGRRCAWLLTSGGGLYRIGLRLPFHRPAGDGGASLSPLYRVEPAALHRHWMHARVLLFLGREPEGEQELRPLLKANPDQRKAMAYFGEILYYEGKFAEAEQALARAMELSRGSGDFTAPCLAARRAE